MWPLPRQHFELPLSASMCDYDCFEDFDALSLGQKDTIGSGTGPLRDIANDSACAWQNALRKTTIAINEFAIGATAEVEALFPKSSKFGLLVEFIQQGQHMLLTHITTCNMLVMNKMQELTQRITRVEYDVKKIHSAKDANTKQQFSSLNANLRHVFRDAVRSVCWIIDVNITVHTGQQSTRRSVSQSSTPSSSKSIEHC